MAKDYWSPDGSTLPDLEEHTRKKHQILEDYIYDWVVTLCSNHVGQKSTLTLIDSFCGGGVYLDKKNNSHWAGSPIRIIHSVEKALEEVRTKRGKPDFVLDVYYIFSDNNRNHLDCLVNQLKVHSLDHYISSEVCLLLEGEFLSLFDKIINVVESRKGHSFFFIDPYGYTDYSMANIRKIMSIPRSEVLLNYMIDFIQRFLSNRDEQLKRALGLLLEANEFYRDLKEYDHNVRTRQAYLRNETIRLFRQQARVQFAYSFGMLTDGQAVKYYLIHLANNATAQKVIKDALWIHNNTYQYQYEIFGMSFKVPQNEDLLIGTLFNINEDDDKVVFDNLEPKLMNLITEYETGLPFKNLQTLTMQENPAGTEHYNSLLCLLRDNTRDLEILRNGNITKAQKLMPNDIIRRAKQRTFNF